MSQRKNTKTSNERKFFTTGIEIGKNLNKLKNKEKMSRQYSNQNGNNATNERNSNGRNKSFRSATITLDKNVVIPATSRHVRPLSSTGSMKTGASLIPDLNVIIERMRNMPDDRFIYLTYMLPKTSEYFTPYSLMEYTWESLPNRLLYFTMSRHGVTYWHLSENFFTPLLQWQQEFQQFLSIIKIRTFAVFRIWKGFKVWEKTVKWKKQSEALAHLQEHLFIAIPHLARAILKMRSEIVFLEKSNFVNVSGKKSFSISQQIADNNFTILIFQLSKNGIHSIF